ncbi:MAG: hypothetical protein A2655_00890 [Candidatus Yanofskybacteria bacterium RIFCSPHIGHO2_01_FULL_43_42]|uniref:Ribosome-binding factor A n=1 Tax=Candidatus Taylorbacteria bacterium RIFCSPLOWO2_01_FULL_45_15b TaxID=1802319 RepID=A0A1G2NFP4_9BACT|nr:MAG: hypothetical protein A2655_00890 [Candidatus Yanofskybacteria bacterium RIFCSPHIGHO2_01_FULL_43_42]OHA34201.1 MAG: hypothetical protein A2928_04765 [Candidatus Taylorbacteria bacterium RIFCSPLOWO2_01_FULL_45_15b]
MTENKDARKKDILRELVSSYILKESSGSSLITVTEIILGYKNNRVTVCCTVLPQEKEKSAMEFLQRKRRDAEQFIRDNSRIYPTPLLIFKIDLGEKNRQKLDEISN